jgi:hypothetical protein
MQIKNIFFGQRYGIYLMMIFRKVLTNFLPEKPEKGKPNTYQYDLE